jgi:formylglycine-generating enzyme required for sulfatase activity
MELPSGWTADHVCGKELWSDVTGDGACDSAEDDCMMRDNVSGQIWTESYPVTETAPAETALSWSQAVAHCNSLTYGERSDWRLPTLMELASLHHHGIREIGYKGGGAIRPGGDSLDNNDFFIPNVDISAWTATSRNTATALGELVQLGEGRLTALDKAANTASFLCTAP